MKLTLDVKQREQRGKNNKDKNNNSCATKKNITDFYTDGFFFSNLIANAFLKCGNHIPAFISVPTERIIENSMLALSIFALYMGSKSISTIAKKNGLYKLRSKCGWIPVPAGNNLRW